MAYAIAGRSGRRGFLQRIAVDPLAQRRGIGAALVVDGLRWLRRWGADRALVNTQEQNEPALLLYERLGFRRQPGGLAVLGIDLADGSLIAAPRRLGMVLVAVVALATLPVAHGAHAAPAQTGGAGLLRLVDQTTVVAPGGEFVVRLQVSGAPVSARLAVTVHDAVTTRSGFARSIEGEGLRRRLRTIGPASCRRSHRTLRGW